MRTGRPVRLVLSRSEVFTTARTRHPQIIRMRTGINNDGTITAVSLNALMNTGAYGSHALTVVCNTGSKVLPLLNKVSNVEFVARSVYTNLPVGGAYRGPLRLRYYSASAVGSKRCPHIHAGNDEHLSERGHQRENCRGAH